MDSLREYFSNKQALVTGASSGIGRELVIELSKLGATVIAVGQKQQKLNELKKELSSRCQCVALNLSNWSETERVLGELCKSVDFLVNNAGVGLTSSVEELTEESIDKVFDVNLKAPMNLIRLVAAGMKERRFGCIVNVSSVAAMAALGGHSVYAASKGGLDMVTKIAALELAPFNVRVNSVNPTVVMTPMSVEHWSEPTKRQLMLSRIPAGRFVEICEVVQPIIFLLSPASTMLNGTLVPIDGGFVAC